VEVQPALERGRYQVTEWRAERDEGMERVHVASSIADKRAVKEAILACSHKYPNFTSDDVMNWLADRNIELREPRLLGPIFIEAVKKGVIQPVICPTCDTQLTVPSKRRHGTPQNVWRTHSKRTWQKIPVA
jgi:hypothetical protein